MSKKRKLKPQYRWTHVTDFPGGHRVFLEDRQGKYAVCDGHRHAPYWANGVALWIDQTRPVIYNQPSRPLWCLPVIADDGTNKAIPVPECEARWAIEQLGMPVMLGGSIFNLTPKAVQIPRKENVGDVGTGHITLSDSVHLDGETVPYQIGVFEYGYMVLTHPKEDVARTNEIREAGMSEAYINLLNVAYAQGYYYLMIDRDGPEVDGLAHFKW